MKFVINVTFYLFKQHKNKKAFTYSTSTNIASISQYIKFSQSRLLCSIVHGLYCLLGRRGMRRMREKKV